MSLKGHAEARVCKMRRGWGGGISSVPLLDKGAQIPGAGGKGSTKQSLFLFPILGSFGRNSGKEKSQEAF